MKKAHVSKSRHEPREEASQPKAGHTLWENNDLLRAIVTCSPVAIVTFDFKGIVQSWNPAAEKMFGWSEAEAIGSRIPYVPEEKWGESLSFMEIISKGKSFQGVQARRMKKDGTPIDISISSGPLRDKAGVIRGILAVSVDVTERNRALRALEESEARYETLFWQLPFPVLVIDHSGVKEGIESFRKTGVTDFYSYFQAHLDRVEEIVRRVRILEVNDATLRFLRVEDPSTLQSKALKTLTKESYEGLGLALTLIAEGKKSFDVELTLQSLDGEKRYVQLRWAVAKGHETTLRRCLIAISDMTERRKMEAALRESESEHRLVFEHMHTAVVVHGPDTRILMCNQEACRVFGLPADELRGRKVTDPAWQLVWEDGSAISPEQTLVHQVLTTGKAVQDRRSGIIGAGQTSPRWVRVSAYPAFDLKKQVRKVVVTFMDVTERKKTEQALQESEARVQFLAQMLEESSQPFGVRDADGRIRFFNRALCELTGYSAEELATLHASKDLSPPEYWQKDLDIMAELRRTGKAQLYQKEYIRKDGGLVPVELLVGCRAKATGEIDYYYAFITDITERKRVQEALVMQARVLETMMEGVCVFTNDGVVKWTNPRFDELFGYARRELVGKYGTALNAYAPDQNLKIMRHILASLEKQGSWTGELLNQRKDGTAFTTLARMQRVEVSGTILNVSVQEDISERKAAQRKEKEYTAKLQGLSRQLVETQESERRAIARELHDQVGQALTAVQINLQTLLGHPETKRLAKRLSDSLGAVDQVLEQVHNLCLELRPSILDDLGLEAALRWYSHQQADRAQLECEFRPEKLERRLEPVIETACFRIAQEAITNILRHAKARKIMVELKNEVEKLHLIVRDDGTGFSAEAARERAIGGGSLGLLSMEERAALVGGWLEYNSMAGQGTEVHAWLPLKWRKKETGTSR